MKNTNGKAVSFLGKIILLILVLVACFIAWSIFKQVTKNKEIEKEISQMEKEAAKINQENILTQEKISYLESRDYREREAKEKLNLKKAEEEVVVVKPGIVKKDVAQETTENFIPQENLYTENNFKKWWNYFTHK